MKKTKRLLFAVCLLIVSATLLGTASYAWFSMNTEVNVDGIRVEAYSDSLFLEISKTKDAPAYETAVDFTSVGEVALRLAKHGFVNGNAVTLTAASATALGSNYEGQPGIYKLVAETVDSYEKYVLAVEGVDLKLGTSVTGLYKNLAFALAGAGVTGNGSTTFYEIKEGKYVPVVLNSGVSAKGYYTLTAGTAELDDTYYTAADKAANAKFYAVNGGAYIDVTSTLEVGTDLSAFYTISATPISASTAADTPVYLTSTGFDVGAVDPTAAKEYAYLCDFTSVEEIEAALYFGRAYSDVIADGDQGDTLSIIKKNNIANYAYKQVVYIRNAENTNNSKNLTATVKVGGAANDISKALRVLLVVNDASGNLVNTAYYDNNDPTDCTFDIIDLLLGNRQETLEVEIYVYFDGTDEIAENSKIKAGILDGQTVSIAFNVDDHAYNEPVTP